MKKSVMIMMVLVMASPCFGAMIGDIDHNGKVEMQDAILGLQVTAVLRTDGFFADADVNNDGIIGLPKVIYALRVSAALNSDFTNSLGMTFKLIPRGVFMMGSPDSEIGRDYEPQHQVTLTKNFYMQSTEVTQGQWTEVMGNNPSSTSSYCHIGNDYPVNTVSLDDVKAFIIKMNQRGEGTYRLPTEAEWEYAARAGTTTRFAFGNCLTLDTASYKTGSESGPYNHPGCLYGVGLAGLVVVTSYQPNSWGLYNMHGNVAEWVASGAEPYPDVPVTDPTNFCEYCSLRRIRGGAWNSDDYLCRSASRDATYSYGKGSTLGFRLVRNP